MKLRYLFILVIIFIATRQTEEQKLESSMKSLRQKYNKKPTNSFLINDKYVYPLENDLVGKYISATDDLYYYKNMNHEDCNDKICTLLSSNLLVTKSYYELFKDEGSHRLSTDNFVVEKVPTYQVFKVLYFIEKLPTRKPSSLGPSGRHQYLVVIDKNGAISEFSFREYKNSKSFKLVKGFEVDNIKVQNLKNKIDRLIEHYSSYTLTKVDSDVKSWVFRLLRKKKYK